MIKLSDYVAKRLKEKYNISNIFMVSGGGAMHLNDSFGKYIPYICNHHEQACSIAAEGYARVNQELAVVNVTTGPGGLNCLNGVFGQWTDSVPVLYISGQVKYTTCMDSCKELPLRQLGDQEVDIISVVKPLTKYAVTVFEPKEIKYHLDRAIYEATTGRFGPVWLNIPMNVQGAMIDEDELIEFNVNDTPHLSFGHPVLDLLHAHRVQPVAHSCMSASSVRYPELDSVRKSALPQGARIQDLHTLAKQVFEKLKTSKRPLIVAGHGIRLSGTKKEFLELVEKLNIPVVTTMNGFDIISENNKNFVARIGTVANRAGNFTLQNADLLLELGTRNNIRQVSYNWENFGKNAFKIVVDIDKAELEKPLVKPDLAINADLKDFIPALLNELGITPQVEREQIESSPLEGGQKQNDCHSEFVSESLDKKWLEFCKNLKLKYPPLSEAERVEHNPIEPYYFINKLIEHFKEDEVVVCGNGSAFLIPFQVGKVKENQRYIWNSGNASMGYDLPAAIGACLANNRKSTVCIAGDGSIMMNLQELQTIKTNNLPIKIFVLNNNGYISIQQTHKNFFEGRYTACTTSSGVEIPNFIKVAKAFDIETRKIDSLDNIDNKIDEVLNHQGCILCEVMLSPNYSFAPKLSARKLEDGTMVSPTLEDMSPFLSKEEFESNIL